MFAPWRSQKYVRKRMDLITGNLFILAPSCKVYRHIKLRLA